MISDLTPASEEHFETDDLLRQAYQSEIRTVICSSLIGLVIAATVIIAGC